MSKGGSDSKESACNTGNLGSTPELERSPGEGNGNPLQYSCLGNPMNGGARRATVHKVTVRHAQSYRASRYIALSSLQHAFAGFVSFGRLLFEQEHLMECLAYRVFPYTTVLLLDQNHYEYGRLDSNIEYKNVSLILALWKTKCVCVLVAQSCLTLCDPMDCSPPGFFVHGILQARILE